MLEVSPFTHFDALLMRGADIETARGIGLDMEDSAVLARMLASLGDEAIARFRGQPDALILGVGLARSWALWWVIS